MYDGWDVQTGIENCCIEKAFGRWDVHYDAPAFSPKGDYPSDVLLTGLKFEAR